ncbi:hypothetical protein [Streptomyces goshikiensis]|uniref:hypothetical protein n=1 Tax=Streptomyces goshikiensis TaxID=1942 RepID=UPI0036629F1E
MDRHGRVVALLDATGTFFEPAEAAFPGAGTEDWARAGGRLHEVDGRYRLAPDLTLLPTPGHQSVLVEQRDGARDVLVTGDVLVHAVRWGNPAVPYSHERDRATERGALLATAHLRRAFAEPP